LKKLEYICAIASLALMGADRLDLFAGNGPFRLTPFLFFSALVVFFHFLSMAMRGTLQSQTSSPVRHQFPFLVGLVLFLFLAFVSTLLGYDPQRGLVALAGLVLVAVLGYCLSVRISADPAPEKLVVRSVTLALIVYLIFCIGGLVAWSHGAFRLQEEAGTSIDSLFAPTATFLWLPRLSGFCLDANRAGFILVMYLALLDQFTRDTRFTRILRWTIAAFILIALSRSAMLCWLAYCLFSTRFWSRLKTPRVAYGAAALVVVCLAAGLMYQRQINGLLDVWEISDALSDRLSGERGTSGGEHLQLIQRGLETWSSSTRTVVTGIGFAGAPRVLGDFFQDNKYANFHSLYVSLLAELGLPAFLVFMILLGYPMIGRKGAAAIIAAIVVFNIALQSYMEPIFWVTLALVWSFERKRGKLRAYLRAAPLPPSRLGSAS
jgi:O-Antigen ligase